MEHREIIVGGSKYQIEYTPKAAMEVLQKIIEWMEDRKHYAAASGEGIMQSDNTIIDAPVLVSEIVDDILKPKFIEEVEY